MSTGRPSSVLQCYTISHSYTRSLATVIGTQWLLCTGHLVSLILQLIRGFIHPPDLPPLGSAARNFSRLPDDATASSFYFVDQSTPEHTAEVAFYILNVSLCPPYFPERQLRTHPLTFLCQGLMTDCFMVRSSEVKTNRRVLIALPRHGACMWSTIGTFG